MPDGETVYTRDRSSGGVHKRILVGERLFSDEADNLDDAGEYEVVTFEQLAEIPGEAFCERCFPRQPGTGDDS